VTTLRAATAASAVVVGLACAVVPDAHAAEAQTASPAVRGLDISAYQHTGSPINWRRLAGQGIRFVGIKATEGTYYRNPFYGADARGAAAAGLTVLPYVFANPKRAGGRATAKFAVQVTGATRSAARLPLVVDLENDPYAKGADCYGRRVAVMKSWIAGFASEAHKLTGRLPIIYTTADWWQECTRGSHFSKAPLWLAAFGGTAPDVPSPWSQWALWQYADNGKLPGIGQVDLDYYQPALGLFPLRASAGHTDQEAKAKKRPAAKKKHTAKKKPAAKKHPAKKHPAKKKPPAKRHAAKKRGKQAAVTTAYPGSRRGPAWA
jgi:GH25 family lysozyme M1 (1,4-beta-N-acetylmuramidase)